MTIVIAGIPTWGLGRTYENGASTQREVPEMKLPLLFGIFGSAFCATLSHYYNEIRPFVTSINLLKTLDNMVLQRTDALVKVHPFDPAAVPNFVKGLKDQLPATCPESLHESDVIQLMVGHTTPCTQSRGQKDNIYYCRMPGCLTILHATLSCVKAAMWIS
jgi:phospholipase A2